MSFQDVIEVEAREYHPLKHLEDKEIAPQLELTVQDLEKIGREIQEETARNGEMPKKGIIQGDFNRKANNFFEFMEEPGRTVSSEYTRGDEQPQYGREVISAKGAGNWVWLSSEDNPPFRFGDKIRKYPMLWHDYAEVNTHRIWGGISASRVRWEYVNALILNALIRKHQIPQGTYKPVIVLQFRELPVLEDGKVKIVSLDDYCDERFEFVRPHPNTKNFRLPTPEEARDLAEFFYRGNLVNLRVPPKSFKDDYEFRHYSAGQLADCSPVLPIEQRRSIIQDFTIKIASLVRIVHGYQGTFTVLGGTEGLTCRPHISSLISRNVSLGGSVCDLDTLRFDVCDPEELKEAQRIDLLFALRTVKSFANLHDEFVTKPRFPVQNFEETALGLFQEIYPIPPEMQEEFEKIL